MRRLAAAAALVLLGTACRRAPAFAPYADPAGRWSLEVPSGWTPDPGPVRLPTSGVDFVGALEPQDEGVPLGAVLSVVRHARRRADHPGGDAAFRGYETAVLKPARELFGDDGGAPASKDFARDYERGPGGPLHGNKSFAMRAEGFVRRTADAYYVVEYRATRENFERYRYALDRARASFRLTPGR